ncbi:MAG: hypothetical protein DRJ38_00625 [Thermoprotei archaeon]|nr:MAG: hypothetical protein DRJ38_00625 [Thermoprotei archaeon]
MKVRGRIVLTIANPQTIDIIYASLIPETQDQPSYRSKSSIEKLPGRIVLAIEARDLVSFRAAVNSYLRLISVLIRVLSELD